MALWTPLDLGAKLAFWWSVGIAGSVTVVTGVSDITDQNGTGYSIQQATTTKQPLYSTTSLNGYPGFTLDGTDDFLATNGAWMASINQPYGFHTIFQCVARPPGDSVLIGHEPGWNGGKLGVGNSGDVYVYANGAAGYVLGNVAASDFAFTTTTFNGTSTEASFNGTLVAAPGSSPGTQDIEGFTIGSNQGTADFSNSVMGDIIITNTTLTTAERQDIEGFLAWSANLASLLPVGHPYKSAPPTTGPPSAALTGVSGTGSLGALGVAVTLALTGVAGTGSIGSLIAGPAQALSGVSATGSTGTFGQTRSVALTGVSATGDIGALSPSTSSSSGLTGVGATTTLGMLTPSNPFAALTGVSGTGSKGSLGISRSVALVGMRANGSIGFLTAPTLIKRLGPITTILNNSILQAQLNQALNLLAWSVPGLVADLPLATTAGLGAQSFVTDATSGTFGAAVVGGGAHKVPIYSDGTQWLVG